MRRSLLLVFGNKSAPAPATVGLGPGPGDQMSARLSQSRHSLQNILSRGISAWDRDEFEDAYASFREILDLHPDFADIRNKAGLCLAMMSDPEGALTEFDRALDLNRSYAEAHFNRALVLNDLGRFDEAEASFGEATALDTGDSLVYPSEIGIRLAVSHAKTGDIYFASEQYDRAAREYEAGLAVRPRFSDIRTKLADAYIQLGRLDEARAELESILETHAGFTSARLRLGVVLHRLGNDEGARIAWERCIEEDHEDSRPRAYLATLTAE